MNSPYYPHGYPMATDPGARAPGGQSNGQASGQASPMVGYAAYGSAAPGYGYAQGYGAMQAGDAYPRQAQQANSLLNFSNDRFLKGLLIGAAATYLLTNESVQRTAIKGVVQFWSALQGGIEEAKERFHDAEAELHHATQSKKEAG